MSRLPLIQRPTGMDRMQEAGSERYRAFSTAITRLLCLQN
jgi:hypothetical protein